jgi:hypothetical protein
MLQLTVLGCVSTRVSRSRDPRGEMAISFAVYLKARDARSGGRTVGGVLSELYIERDGRWELLRREERGEWTLSGLVPGRYRIRVVKWAKPDGEIEELDGDNEETFTLREGESARLRVVLEKTPTGLIIVLSITVVVLVAVLIYLLVHDDLDLELPAPDELPLPPVPPVPRFMRFWLPPPDVVILDFIPPPAPQTWAEEQYAPPTGRRETGPPRVIDYYPLDGDSAVPRDSTIWLEFSAPLDPESLDHRNFVVQTARGAEILGGIYYDESRERAVFHPLRPLAPGEEITVTLYGQAIRSARGRRLSEAYRWTFACR